MSPLPLILYSFLNEPLAPEDFEIAMDDLQSAGESDEFQAERSQLSQMALTFAPWNTDAA